MDFFQQIDNIALLEPAAHFELFRSISNALNSKDSGIQAVGRNHLIKVIDVWEDVPSTLKPMWEDLIEAVGFYPYIEKYKMTLTDLDARIRQEYHRSEYIFDKTLHSKQKELSDLILSKQNVVVSAPTSFGKSLLIEEIVASGIYTNIVIIQPTLALLDETRIKLKRYFDQYKGHRKALPLKKVISFCLQQSEYWNILICQTSNCLSLMSFISSASKEKTTEQIY